MGLFNDFEGAACTRHTLCRCSTLHRYANAICQSLTGILVKLVTQLY